MPLWPLCDMAFNVLHLLRPTAVIPAECFRAAVARDLVEAGLREQKQRAAGGLLQLEFDERGRLLRIVRFGIDGIRVPGEGKEPFRLHLLHDGLPYYMLVARVGYGAPRDLTRYEWAIEFHAKPPPKLTVVRQCAPHPRNRRRKFHALLDAVVHLKQPPGCILARRGRKSNLLVALYRATWTPRQPIRGHLQPCKFYGGVENC